MTLKLTAINDYSHSWCLIRCCGSWWPGMFPLQTSNQWGSCGSSLPMLNDPLSRLQPRPSSLPWCISFFHSYYAFVSLVVMDVSFFRKSCWAEDMNVRPFFRDIRPYLIQMETSPLLKVGLKYSPSAFCLCFLTVYFRNKRGSSTSRRSFGLMILN